MSASAYTVAFAPERAQYCVQRADGLRIWPTPQVWSDPDAAKRAEKLADALNRMEDEARDDARIPGPHCACGASLDWCEETRAFRRCGAEVARNLRKGEA